MCSRFAGIAILIVYLHILYVRELFQVQHQRAGDRIQRAVGLAISFQIHMRNAIRKFKFAVSCKSVEDQCKILIALHIAGAFEEFIQNRSYKYSR